MDSCDEEKPVEVSKEGEDICPYRAYVELDDAYARRESALTGQAENQSLRVPT